MANSQHGARSGENITTEIDGNDISSKTNTHAWSFPQHVSTLDSIRRTLHEISGAITPLKFQDATEPVQAFKSLVGYVGGVQTPTNPFIPTLDISVEDICTRIGYCQEPLKQDDLEILLRELLISGLDNCRIVYALMKLASPKMLRLIKKTILLNLELNGDSWNSWRKYSGFTPSTIPPEQEKMMEGDYIHFHQIVDDTLADIIKELREFTNTVDHVDVEKLLQRWRMMDGYFKDTKSWEEVLIQERLIWNQLTVIVPLPWITRKEHLMILLRRPEMGFTDSVIDQKLVALDDSEDYYVWCKHVEHLFKLASIKSLKFRGVTEPARCKYCRRYQQMDFSDSN